MRHYTLKKYLSRLVAVLLCLLFLGGIAPRAQAATASGSCGSGLSWTLDGDILTITGSGAMTDFPESTMAPWYNYRREISQVILPEGLTSVGNLAFYGFTALTSVSIPDSVTRIGWYAFAGCTGMTMLDLPDALMTIEDSAFQECTSLPAVRLPGGLKNIGRQAFYRCEALTEITVPASVNKIGDSCFAFCYKLIRADIRAAVTILPEWTFYGCTLLTDLTLPESITGAKEFAFYDCESLSQVCYTGSEENLQQIQEDIQRDRDGTAGLTSVGRIDTGDSSSGMTYEETENGPVGNIITSSQTEGASIATNVTIEYPETGTEGRTDAQVDVTLETADDYSEIGTIVDQIAGSSDNTQVNIYIKDDTTLTPDAITDLAGDNVSLTIHSPGGSVYTIDCSNLDPEGMPQVLNLNYRRINATEAQLKLMNCNVGYEIRFQESSQVDAEVLIKLPVDCARASTTLFRVDRKEKLADLQTVLVDNIGYAHFYLASVDSEAEYLLGINVPGFIDQAIIPQNMLQEYGLEQTAEITYTITGRTSSWNMTFNQVTWIMVAFLGTTVIVVGIVMYSLNKRRLRMGYVPDLDDEYDE